MDFITNQLNNIGLDPQLILRTAVLLAVASILLGAIGRFVFGKRSIIHCAVSSAIGILFVYVVTIVLHTAGAQFQKFIAPLPFIDIAGVSLHIFSFRGSDLFVICEQVLSMVILAFLVNILDSILPRGKNLFAWLLLRILTVAGAMALHLLSLWLIGLLLPQGIMQYAPLILLVLLLLLVVVGGLKIIVGAVLTTVNPIIGILYTFFFANIVGKAITKAMLTAGILAGLVFLLEYIGVSVVSISQATLMAYIPMALVLLAVWFVVTRVFEKK